MAVYVLHFASPYKQARHYLGYAKCVERRVQAHRQGSSVPLMRAVHDAGISFTVARVWENGDKALERQLRNQHNTPRLCPLCSASLSSSSRGPMTKTKKPSTHCDKYGHAWIPSTLYGFEVCSNTDYIGGKLVRCPATRKQGTEDAFFAPTTKQDGQQPDVPQQSLW